MAVIKYQIKGTADTRPITQTGDAVEGLFKKIERIDEKLKGFIGVKVFSEVSKAINTSLKEYDAFKKSIGEESAFAKQMKDLQTTMAGTLGTVRDSIATSIGDALGKITGSGSSLENLQEKIMQAGASLAAGFSVASRIAENIAKNLSEGLSPIKWDGFFNRAMNLASKFGTFLFHALKDAFNNAIEFFRFLIGNPMAEFMDNQAQHWRRVYQGMGIEVPEIPSYKELNKEPITFGMSDETKKAFEDLTGELGKTAVDLLDKLAGEPVSDLFGNAYKEALSNIKATVGAMKASATGGGGGLDLKGVENALKDAISAATGGYNKASSNIGGILGDATGKSADKIRETMKDLDDQFNSASETIKNLQAQLATAKTQEEIDGIAAGINAAIGDINGLANSMNELEGPANKAKNSFDLLQGVLGAIGELGQIIQVVFMSGNPIGLIILGITKLLEAFSGLENGGESVAGVMNIVSTLFNVVSQVIGGLGPALSLIFMPILDIVSALGGVLGGLLNIIVPIIAMVVQLISAFDVLTPILNFVSRVLAAVADGFGWLYNTVSDIVRGITFGFLDMGHVATDNLARLNAMSQENSWSSNTNNSTSYNVAGDLYIFIHYDRSYVNGDAREIALNIRNEIRMAEAAGY